MKKSLFNRADEEMLYLDGEINQDYESPEKFNNN